MTKFIDQMFEDTGLLQYNESTEQGISKAEAEVIIDYVHRVIVGVINNHDYDMLVCGYDGGSFGKLLKDIEAKVK